MGESKTAYHEMVGDVFADYTFKSVSILSSAGLSVVENRLAYKAPDPEGLTLALIQTDR